MAIDLDNEAVVFLTKASHSIRSRPSTRTMWRWSEKGVRGIRLETALIGGRRVTSTEAIGRFLAALNADTQPAPSVSSRRETAIARAERELDAAGL